MKIRQRLATLKAALNVFKPCLKGIIMVIIGMLNTRAGIGIGRLTSNLLYGLIGFGLIAISGLFIMEMIKMRNLTITIISPIELRSDLFSAIFAFSGIAVIVLYSIFANLGFLPILISFLIVILLYLLALIALNNRKYSRVIGNIITTLIFSLGLIFGATLNNAMFSLPIWLFFLGISLLQMPRELMKDAIKVEEWSEMDNAVSNEEVLKVSSILIVISIAIIVIALFSGLRSPLLYLYLVIIALIFISFALLKIKKQAIDGSGIESINKLLKYTIFFQMIAFVAAAF